jgi:hypothetical protein
VPYLRQLLVHNHDAGMDYMRDGTVKVVVNSHLNG